MSLRKSHFNRVRDGSDSRAALQQTARACALGAAAEKATPKKKKKPS